MDRSSAVEDFNELAPVYDQTRPPLDPAIAARLAAALKDRGIRRVLEVGVGTGRIASPLQHLGLEVTGIDAAPAMIARAHAKGIERLALASAYALPFRPASFDATIFAHVLHTLDRPEAALREAQRVSRRGVFALILDRTPIGRKVRSPAGDQLRRLLREELAREGIELPPTHAGGPARRERLILRKNPPAERLSLGERTVQLPIDRRLSWVERRADRSTLRLPQDAVRRAVERVRARLPADQRNAMVAFRRAYELARWPGSGPRALAGTP